MTGPAVFLLLAGMVGGWALRRALLARLRKRHPDEYARLGAPSSKEMLSHLPRHREKHLALWRFVWGGEHRRLADAAVHRIAWAVLAADLAMIAGAVLLFAQATRT